MMRLLKPLILALTGGITYVLIEILFRGYSHISMFILGGVLFLEIGYINELFPWDMSLILQGIIGSAMITVSELVAGIILNIWLGLNVWDYSSMPLNFMGQICLPFSIAWFFVAIAAVILDDWLRYLLFGEERPHYRI